MNDKKIHLDTRRFPETLRFWRVAPAACAQHGNDADYNMIPVERLTRDWHEVTCLNCQRTFDYNTLRQAD
nr:hypothetical protein [bacterium]